MGITMQGKRDLLAYLNYAFTIHVSSYQLLVGSDQCFVMKFKSFLTFLFTCSKWESIELFRVKTETSALLCGPYELFQSIIISMGITKQRETSAKGWNKAAWFTPSSAAFFI